MSEVINSILSQKAIHNQMDLVDYSRTGISIPEFYMILDYIQMSVKEIASTLPISERQLLRYDKDHRLRKDISSQLLNVLELYVRGYEVFGEHQLFKSWMKSEVTALDRRRPIDLLDTSFGIQMILNIIGRIEHGVLS